MGERTTMAEAGSPLRIERSDDRVVATLDRPETRNAIDQELVDCLHAVCSELEADPCVLILTGAGGVFASGADIGQLRDRRAEDARKGINTTAFRRIRSLPMPVIAAIDGWALGGGAELAYAADIRIATPEAKIGNPETSLGIIAAAGATWRLPEIVGHARASELLLTGRILTAEEALVWGLVSSLHAAADLLPAAHAIADRVAAADPLATRHTKTALLAPADAHPAIELELQAELFESPEKIRRMTEFLERKRR
jgi:enoyl-CoA hydratase